MTPRMARAMPMRAGGMARPPVKARPWGWKSLG